MNTTPKPYDVELYALHTKTLLQIAEREGATNKVAKATATIFSVAGELFTNERDAFIYAIEHNRRMRQKGGKAK